MGAPVAGMAGAAIGTLFRIPGTAVKWVLGLGAVATGAEVATNSDGRGGIFGSWWRRGSNTVAIETSGTQAVDNSFDMVSGASNKITSIISGGLATILEAIGHFTGNTAFMDAAKKCRDFEQRNQQVIAQRVQASRAADGSVGYVGPHAPVDGQSGPGNLANPKNSNLLLGGALATAGVIGIAAPTAISMMRGGQSAATAAEAASAGAAAGAEAGATRATAGIHAAEGAARTGFFSRMASKIPFVGRYFAVGGAVVAGAGAYFGSNSAEAAVPSTTTAGIVARGTGVGTLQAAGAEIGGVGLSIVAAKTAAQAAAPLAASVGLRAIPGIAAIYNAGEGLYNTGRHALRGEWAQAGTALVAGTGATVAGLGGALTAPLGVAWHEAVREGGAMVFGRDKMIEHNTVTQGVMALRNAFFGPSTGTTAGTIQRDSNFIPVTPALTPATP